MLKVNLTRREAPLTFLLSLCLGLSLVLLAITSISWGSRNPSPNPETQSTHFQSTLDHQITLTSFNDSPSQIADVRQQEISALADNSGDEPLIQVSLAIATKSANPTPAPPALVVVSILPAITSPSATPTATPKKITPKTAKVADPTPIPLQSIPPTPAGSLDADKIFVMVNAYRASLKLPDFQKDDRACTLAASRAPEVNHEIATGTMHKGLRTRDLDYWNSENIISMNSEKAAFNWWIHDKIHKDAIEGDYKYSCIACFGQACVQEFTNFLPK